MVDPFYKVYTKRGEASDSRGRFIKADYRSRIWEYGIRDYRSRIWEYGIRDGGNTADSYIVYNLIMERLKCNKKKTCKRLWERLKNHKSFTKSGLAGQEIGSQM